MNVLKRIGALFVLMLFVASMVPVAFAEESPADQLYQAIDELNALADKKTAAAQEAKVVRDKKIEELTALKTMLEDLEAKVESGEMTWAEARSETIDFKKAAKEKIADLKESFKETRAIYQEQKTQFKEAKSIYSDMRAEAKKVCETEPEKCPEMTADFKRAASFYMLAGLDVIDSLVETVKARAASFEDTDPEYIAEVLDGLEAQTESLAQTRAMVEALDQDSTDEEVKAAGKAVREEWKRAKLELHRGIGLVLGQRMFWQIERMKAIDKRLTDVIGELGAQGEDVGNLEALQDEFNLAYNAAEADYEDAEMAYKAAITDDDIARGEAKTAAGKARSNLKEAFGVLKEIKSEFQSIGQARLAGQLEATA